MKKLTLEELQDLSAGDEVWVRYWEDGEDGPRTDCKHEVIARDNECLYTRDLPSREEVWEFFWLEWDEPAQQFDCSHRGKGEIWRPTSS